MRLPSGMKIGQSGHELSVAVVFSLLLHLFVFFAAVFLYLKAVPKVYVPPFYQVSLVGQPANVPPPPVPVVPKQEEPPKANVPAPKAKKAVPKPAKAVAKKGGIPELIPQKQKAQQEEAAKPQETTKEQPAGAAGVPSAAGAKTEPISVAGPREFKFPPYMGIIRDKIGLHWNPPPGVKELKVKVSFRLLRSGRVADTRLEESSGNFYFDQAAMRAILSSSPFPPLPEGFAKEFEFFTVDLMENE